jgi:hypothetical protein
MIWIAAGVLVVGWFLWSRSTPSPAKLVQQAVRTGDPGPLIDAIVRKRPSAQPTAFNFAIRMLWDKYERRLALDLIKELAARHGNEKIAQFWLQQALTVEPEIARGVLPQTFVAEHFRPEVAAQCGPAG